MTKKKPLRSIKNVAAQLMFANQNLNKPHDFCNNILCTDETEVAISGHDDVQAPHLVNEWPQTSMSRGDAVTSGLCSLQDDVQTHVENFLLLKVVLPAIESWDVVFYSTVESPVTIFHMTTFGSKLSNRKLKCSHIQGFT